MRSVLLLSGGFDSPVAGYLMQKKGLEIVAVHFSTAPFTDDEPEKKCRKIAKHLGFHKLYIVNTGKEFVRVSKECNHRLYFVLTKRLMVKIAEKIAKKEKADFLITGENLGQVSSQTLQNLDAITRAAKLPILRPLLCMDKEEIINIAKEIGTYETSIGPEVCEILGPIDPTTKARIEDVEFEEEKITKEFIERPLKGAIYGK